MALNYALLVFLGLPIAFTLFFLISLVLYIVGKRRCEKYPEKYDGQVMQDRKTMLTVSAVLWGLSVFLFVFLVFFSSVPLI